MEKRDFEPKTANMLHVYKEVEIVNEYRAGEARQPLRMLTISYDEKPGIQVLGTTAPDRPQWWVRIPATSVLYFFKPSTRCSPNVLVESFWAVTHHVARNQTGNRVRVS